MKMEKKAERTVAELMARLQEYPSDTLVWAYGYDERLETYGTGPVRVVEMVRDHRVDVYLVGCSVFSDVEE